MEAFVRSAVHAERVCVLRCSVEGWWVRERGLRAGVSGMSLDAATIAGFKVAELKAELEQRGLSTTGKKADLAARLTEAVENEAGGEEEAPAEAVVEAAAEEPVAPAAAEEVEEPVAPAAAEEPSAAEAAAAAAAPAESGAAAEEEELDEFELAKKKRAERFGIPYNPPSKKDDPPEDEDPIEKIKRQRAERFGLPYEPPNSTFAARHGPTPRPRLSHALRAAAHTLSSIPIAARRFGLMRLTCARRGQGQEQAKIG